MFFICCHFCCNEKKKKKKKLFFFLLSTRSYKLNYFLISFSSFLRNPPVTRMTTTEGFSSLVLVRSVLTISKRKYATRDDACQRAEKWLASEVQLEKECVDRMRPKMMRSLNHFYHDVHAEYDLGLEVCFMFFVLLNEFLFSVITFLIYYKQNSLTKSLRLTFAVLDYSAKGDIRSCTSSVYSQGCQCLLLCMLVSHGMI